VLNPLRLGLAFALIGIVTTAMGTTLPLLAHALARTPLQLGAVLGRLYGWNTLGATAGALAGEAWLYGVVGRAAGFIAGGLSLLAAISRAPRPQAPSSTRWQGPTRRCPFSPDPPPRGGDVSRRAACSRSRSCGGASCSSS
jgi:hypothetical protein